ncbi:hypothetical protein SSX86_021270 [Deinandra increscens subsp. villosa]|uniref:Protein kinase domain-containing protein n=1 Tax=Deinandra increscens subsp. villosa TaxID=3103831 RepID=A0AAP0CPE1_9ASTR
MSVPTAQEVESPSSSSSPQLSRRFTFSEIQLATQNLDESLVIGRGGFGKVYKGTITTEANLLPVAIKRLDSTSNQGASEFWAEVNMLSNLRHCHLVSLIGYCNDEQEMILIYEYMSHGSLEDHLHKRQTPLSWVQRLTICIGAARGLDYLHTGTGIKHGVVHRDVKTSNILLHNSWEAKISDFGLSKICPRNQQSIYVNTGIKGTFGYLDPDYFYTGKLTRKSDVYAFGVVLFEVLCGKQALDSSIEEEHWGLAIWAQESIKEGRLKEIVDTNMRGVISPKCLKLFALLAKRCLHKHLKQRPTMAEVVVCLESILALQEKANNTLQPIGMHIFAKKALTVLFPSIGKNSSSVGKNYYLELHINALLGENHALPRFDFDALVVATEDFSEANKIVESGYDRLFKGKLLNGQGIAVSCIYRADNEEWTNNELMLVKLEHENLPKLLGYCMEGNILCYVYDFVPHTSLHHLIFDPWCTLLNWDSRYKIILGISRALLYLHKHAPIQIVHCDVKPGNILLDESFNPKLSSFSCATEIKEDTYSDRICRTIDYMAPEYALHGKLSVKIDVYSFGVLVLVIITGLRAWTPFGTNGHRGNGLIGEYVSMIMDVQASCLKSNPRLSKLIIDMNNINVKRSWFEGILSSIIDSRIDVDSHSMTRFFEIGLLCVQKDAKDRPTMEEVVSMLLDSSTLTLPVEKMRARIIRENSDPPSAPLDNDYVQDYDTGAVDEGYDTGAVDEFISELFLR